MKNKLALLAITAFAFGTIGCSSAPKQEETQEIASAPVAEAAPMITEEQPPVDTTSATTLSNETNQDLSLGAGSSGRGH